MVDADLGIGRETVLGHVKAIYAAFGVSSRAELLVGRHRLRTCRRP